MSSEPIPAPLPGSAPRGRGLPALALAVGLLAAVLALAAGPAQGAVGVEKVSRSAGAPGDRIEVTLGCGFCYPPCHGARGHRQPSPCMLGTKAEPPTSFPISLAPIDRVPEPHPCGPNALCSPQVSAPPARAPFTLLGLATPPQGLPAEPVGRRPVPRYALRFDIPSLRPGVYAFVVFCDVCARGAGGSLIADPGSPLWRLRVR